MIMIRDSSVSKITGYRLQEWGVISGRDGDFFSPPLIRRRRLQWVRQSLPGSKAVWVQSEQELNGKLHRSEVRKVVNMWFMLFKVVKLH
jgi:hypothetical protein